MNFESLEASLPNGFHDALLKNLTIDYMTKSIQISFEFLVSNLSESTKYSAAELRVMEFDFCIIDTPSEGYPYNKVCGLSVDAGSGQPSTSPVEVPSGEGDLFWIWVSDWNSFIRISAKDMELVWK